MIGLATDASNRNESLQNETHKNGSADSHRKARQPLPNPTDLAHLHIAELLDFRPDEGIIRLHEQRVVL